MSRLLHRSPLLPVVGAIAACVGAGTWIAVQAGSWLPAAPAGLAAVLGTVVLTRKPGQGTRTVLHTWSPAQLAERRKALFQERTALEDAQEFQRGVFEVSAELVGCVDEADARSRFTAALRRYWACSGGDLLVWEQGAWRSLGGAALGGPPELVANVQLPDPAGGDLILDLSAGIPGKGALVLRQARPQPSLEHRSLAEQVQVAEILQSQLALSLRRVLLYSQLQALARVDPMTGTHRRWYGESRLKELLKASAPVAVAVVDIDHFKKVNDTFGHAAGDQVLAAVGRTLTGLLRTNDLVCRYGGEEFLVILADTDSGGAALVAERLRQQIAALSGLPTAVTISLGVAAALVDEAMYDLVARADACMYQAKHNGRNQVVVASPPSGEITLRPTTRLRRGPGADGAAGTAWTESSGPTP